MEALLLRLLLSLRPRDPRVFGAPMLLSGLDVVVFAAAGDVDVAVEKDDPKGEYDDGLCGRRIRLLLLVQRRSGRRATIADLIILRRAV
jgi:hypothetical protein